MKDRRQSEHASWRSWPGYLGILKWFSAILSISQIQWNLIGWSTVNSTKNHDFQFDHFQDEFGAHTLWISSTYEYSNFTNGELQTHSRNGFMVTFVFWHFLEFVWCFHLTVRPSYLLYSMHCKNLQNSQTWEPGSSRWMFGLTSVLHSATASATKCLLYNFEGKQPLGNPPNTVLLYSRCWYGNVPKPRISLHTITSGII